MLSHIKMSQMTSAFGPDLGKGLTDYLRWKHAMCVSYLCIEQHVEDVFKSSESRQKHQYFSFPNKENSLNTKQKQAITYQS